MWITFGIVAGGQCHRPENKTLGLCTSRCPPKLGVEAGKGVCFARDGRAPRQRLMRTRGQRLGPIVRCYYAPSEAARFQAREPESGVPPPHRPSAVSLSVRLGRVWRAHRSALWMRGQGCSRRLAGLLECCAQRCNAGGAWILFCTTRPHKAAVRESSSLSPPARVAGASVNFTLH